MNRGFHPQMVGQSGYTGQGTAHAPVHVPELIKDVWANNLEEEMVKIRDVVERYSWIAMDTEFPGVVARPIGNFTEKSKYQYQQIRVNVDMLNIIQIGLTFTDDQGNLPLGTCTWQFHFKLNIAESMAASESIELLQRSGINFDKHEKYGIEPDDFGELLVSSGIVLLDRVKWVTFHSGTDFGYLLKMVTCSPLPSRDTDFFNLLSIYFPTIYDIKHIMMSTETLRGGLQDVADELGVSRIGPQHQAGSDSLLTTATFFKMRKTFFENRFESHQFANVLYGLGESTPR